MAPNGKWADAEDHELTYNSRIRDIQRSPSHNGASGVLEQDEREIRRMGKFSQYKVGRDSVRNGEGMVY